MREFRTSGSVRGAASNGRPYRELISRADATGNSRVTLPFATSSEGREVGAHLRQSTPCPLASYSRPEYPDAGHLHLQASRGTERPISSASCWTGMECVV